MKRFAFFVSVLFVSTSIFANEYVDLFMDSLKKDMQKYHQEEIDGTYLRQIDFNIKNNNSLYFDGKIDTKEEKIILSSETIDFLCHIDNLKDLTLKNVGLKFIPNSIEKLTKLESLDLSDNELMELPETLGRLEKLMFLFLDNNYLSDLPKSIKNLKLLVTLSLKNNKFKVLPDILRYCLMCELNFDENNLLNLPSFVAQMPNLTEIQISKNPNFQIKGEGDSFGKLELAKLFIKQKEVSLYKEKHKDFYKILRSSTEKKRGEDRDKFRPYFSAFKSPKIIAQHSQIEEDFVYPPQGKKTYGDHFVKGGNKLTYLHSDGEEYPIGYTIYFPENEIKSIRVDVYGGKFSNSVDDLFTFKANINNLVGSNAYLARNGVMIIKLLLRDLIDDRVNHQSEMNQAYMDSIQAGIHCFWETLTNHPEDLHQDLAQVKSLPKYLYGASFGGLTCLFQATQYSGTWDGYISHNGSLSPEKRGEWSNDKAHYDFLKLDLERLNQLEDPVLILGNMHDNNVNMRNWTYFYEKICEVHKEHFVKSWFTYKGININHDKIENTGHFSPNDPEELLAYSNVMLDFINKDEVILNDTLSQYINLIGLIKSYENDISASVEKFFLLEAFKKQYEKQQILTDEELLNLYKAISFVKDPSVRSGEKFDYVRKATNAQLQKAFARDYMALVYFLDDYTNPPQSKNIFNFNSTLFSPIGSSKAKDCSFILKNFDLVLSEEELDLLKKEASLDSRFIPQFLNEYRSILESSSYWSNSKDLVHCKLMCGLFAENSELVSNYSSFNKEGFEKAKQKWEEFKLKENSLKVELEKDQRLVVLLKKSLP
jgi:hypothetical protein